MINNEKKNPPLKITYPLILENVNDLVCIVEPIYDYKFLLINETYSNILGYSSKDLIGESFLNYLHLDNVKRIVKTLKKGSISLEDLKELRFRAKDGKFLWFEAKVKKYEENNQKQIIIILRNISERKNLEDKFKEVESKVKELTNLIPEIRFWKLFYPKKYEEALRASYQMLQMVMDNIPEYLFWKDTNLVYLGCNNNYADLIGVGSPENILGKTDNELFDDKEKQDLLVESESKIIDSGTAEFNTINSWVLNSGESVWLDINRIPLRDSENKIVGLLVTYDDITKRINAESQLKESEEKFRTISERSLMGIFIIQDDQIKYINQVASTSLGYTTDEIKSLPPKGYLNLFHQDERDLIEDVANQKQKGVKGARNYFQIRALKKSGDIMWVDLFVRTFNYMGKPAGLITAIDITQRKNTEQMLKESEDIFRIITEQSFMGIAILQDNLVKYHNQRFAEITEFKSEEINNWSQKDFLNIFHPYDKTLVAKQLAEKQEEYEGQNLSISHTQVQGIKKSGHTVWYEVFAKTIPYEGDYAEFIMLIDITESKQSEDKLIDSEEKYRHLFESSPNMICLVDISRVIIDFNTAFQTFSGYKKEELIGKDLFELPNFTPDARSTFIAKNKELLKRGYIQPIEIKLYDKKGHFIWVSLQASFVETGITTLIEIIMSDITDRKLSEDLLQMNEARLEALLKLSQMGDVSELQIFDYVAEKSVELTQSSVGCLLLMNMDNMSLEFCSCSNQSDPCLIKDKHTYSLKETSLWKDAVLAREAIIANEYTGLKKFSTCDKNTDGKINRYLTIPILDRNNIEAVICVMNKEAEYNESDVHQLRLFMDDVWKYLHQKRAREAVLESEKKYRNLLETSSIGILEFDLINRQLTYVNPKLLNILGFEEDSYLDQQVFEKSIHPEDIKKFYDTSIINELELRIYDQAGNLKWLGGNRVNNYNEKEELIGFRVWLEDVTEKKMYEKLIYELNINFLSFTTDFQNNIEKLIETCNKLLDASVVLYCRKIMQEGAIKYQVLSSDKKIRTYDSEEFKKNLLISELFNENHDYIQSFYDINESNYNNDEFIKNYNVVGCNGKLIKSQEEFNSAICVFYREHPVVSHKVKLVLFSISGAIEIEERRWQVQQDLEKQSKLKSDLLSRTSHELKTPLISIKGFTELLLTLHSSKLDTDVISILGEIKEGGNRLERLINSLLESSRLDQNQLKLNKTTEDISFLIKFCVKELEGLSELRKQTINLKIHEYLTSNFDKERIYEVISNLLLNAIKYTPPGGTITIRTEVKKKYYIISVEDNGIGITEEEKKDQLFNQFGKIERYGKGWDIDIEGSGLGLYISKKLVELHGGMIWVESEGRNKGSKFFFSLPIISE